MRSLLDTETELLCHTKALQELHQKVVRGEEIVRVILCSTPCHGIDLFRPTSWTGTM